MTETELQLSDQAVGALMMALQKSLMDSEAGLMVMNPPMVKFDNEEPDTDDA